MECVRLVISHSLLHRPSLHLFPIPFYRTDVRFVNVAFVTLDSTTLLYTYISRFSANPHYQQQLYLRPSFIPIFNFSHKQPTFAFTGESGYTLGFRRKIAHKGLHGETGAFPPSATGWLVPPAKLPPKGQQEEADARLMACVRFLRYRSPAGSLFGWALSKHMITSY